MNWFIYTDDHRWLRRYYPGALALSTFRNSDGELESGQYAFWVQWDTKAGGGGWIEPKWFHEDVAQAFRIGDATVPVGSYDFADLQIVLNMGQGKKARTGKRDQVENVQVARFRIRAALDARASGNAFVQYNSTTTASTSTCVCATLSRRGRTSGSSTTKVWIPTWFVISPRFGHPHLSRGRSW